jgi:hypothetical protein
MHLSSVTLIERTFVGRSPLTHWNYPMEVLVIFGDAGIRLAVLSEMYRVWCTCRDEGRFSDQRQS